MERYKVGDILRSAPRDGIDPVTNEPYRTVRREITAVRKNGYSWKYPEYGEKTAAGYVNSFRSEDSNDCFMEAGWTLERVDT